VTIEEAAGVLCWRRSREGLEVLLVHRPRYDDWSWPKGKAEGDEPLPQTAVREAREETCLAVVLGRPLGEVRYRLPDGRRKRVAYWAATAAAAPRPGERAHEPGAEVDQVAWLPVEQARARLTRPTDEEPLALLAEHEGAGTLATVPVIVLRHGTSRPRDSWARADADRPLVSAGRRQARGLVALLPVWAPERIVSSPWRRCLETVAPFAAAAGLDVRAKNALSEDGARRRAGRTRRQVRRLLERGAAVLLCTHRPVLAEVFDVVRTACDPDVAGAVPAKDPYLAPGEVLVAHVAVAPAGPARVVAVERHQPRV
jgi:8-oxo-dGTP pyrophosphatase MutT (NUDIX family)/phosphohistidine phosphatase SixA